MSACTCISCTSPAYGAPGYAHCAACCAGSLIEEYDHRCSIAEHRAMAVCQFGELPPSTATSSRPSSPTAAGNGGGR